MMILLGNNCISPAADGDVWCRKK